MESKTRHESNRAVLQMSVTWFTFFITLNYTMVGGAALHLDKLRDYTYYILVFITVFIAQAILASIFTWKLRNFFKTELSEKSRDAEGIIFKEFLLFYKQAAGLMVWAVGLIYVPWIALLIFVLRSAQ